MGSFAEWLKMQTAVSPEEVQLKSSWILLRKKALGSVLPTSFNSFWRKILQTRESFSKPQKTYTRSGNLCDRLQNYDLEAPGF
jgi:hypothetical protein